MGIDMIEIKRTEDDDSEFVTLVSQLVNGVLTRQKPEIVFVIHLDNWFGHKWYRFSGGYGRGMEIPKFNPNRVLSQKSLIKSATDGSYRQEEMEPLHCVGTRAGGHDKRRPDDSTVYVWYSSRTLKNLEGSVMVYAGQPEHWYASFVKEDAWRQHRVEGVSRAEFDSYMKAGGAESDSETISDTH